jgi:hypothetical protein
MISEVHVIWYFDCLDSHRSRGVTARIAIAAALIGSPFNVAEESFPEHVASVGNIPYIIILPGRYPFKSGNIPEVDIDKCKCTVSICVSYGFTSFGMKVSSGFI